MTNQKSTKKTLLTSALSLVLCIAMLIGTTFAWFTDNVTSAGNKIVAGNLDVQLLMNTGDGYKDISDSTSPIFGAGSVAQNNNAETLWEPGKTQIAYLAIKNNGNLALKYTVALDVENVSKDLYKVMEYAITPNAQYDAKPAWAGGNAVTEGVQSVSGNVSLGVGATHYFALSIHMQETAGNEYMNGEVNFDLTVLATQDTVEADSFDNKYDVNAKYDGEVGTQAELAGALKKGGRIKVVNDIALTETVEVPADVVAILNLNGKTISGAVKGIKNNGTLTIEGDGTIDVSAATETAQAVDNFGTLTINGGTYKGTKALFSYTLRNAGVMTVNEAEVVGGFGGIGLNGGTAVIQDGTYTHTDDEGAHVVYVAEGANLTIYDGNYVGYMQENNYSQYTVYAATGANVTINGGNFVAETKANGQKAMFNAGAPIAVNSGTYDVDPSAFVSGSQVVDNGNGTWTVRPYAVSNAVDMVGNLTSGNNVALTEDIVVPSTVNVASGNNVLIDLNGNDINYAVANNGASAILSNKGTLNIVGEGNIAFVAANPDLGAIPSYATNTITNTGTLVIGEGVTVTNGSEGGASYAVDNHGTFVLNGGTLIGDRCALRVAKYNQDNVSFVMNSGLVKAKTPAWIQLPGSSSTTAPKITVTINGGTFQSTKESSADNNVLYTYSYGNSHANTIITINGGEFLGGTVSIGSGYKGDAPALIIDGGTFEYDVLQWLEGDVSKVLYTANK